jgi:hypothetical protein
MLAVVRERRPEGETQHGEERERDDDASDVHVVDGRRRERSCHGEARMITQKGKGERGKVGHTYGVI